MTLAGEKALEASSQKEQSAKIHYWTSGGRMLTGKNKPTLAGLLMSSFFFIYILHQGSHFASPHLSRSIAADEEDFCRGSEQLELTLCPWIKQAFHWKGKKYKKKIEWKRDKWNNMLSQLIHRGLYYTETTMITQLLVFEIEKTRPLQIKAPRGEKQQGKEMFIVLNQLKACIIWMSTWSLELAALQRWE